MPALDLRALLAAYKSHAVTPSAFIAELADRLDAYDDPALWIHRLSREDLLAHAARVERRGLESQPLYGVPFAIKDNIDLAGAPTTAGCPAFAYRPAWSASVVQRLLDAGAIPVGKTNLDQFATGLVGTRSPYGTPRNPFRSDVIPGGSSSGSAVAVAAGLVSFALGTDTAGSGRVPAGLNNIVGLKPTRGAWSTAGVVPACRSLDCVSVFALNCDDADLVRHVVEGFDPADPFSRIRHRKPRSLAKEKTGLNGVMPLRVGVPASDALDFFGDKESQRLFADCLGRISTVGASLVPIDFAPFRETASLLYQGPWVAERWAALRRFHADHAADFHPVTRQIIEAGAQPSAADAFEGIYRLESLRRRTEAEWEKMDVLLVPTAPRAYTLAEVAAEPILTNSRLGTYTNFVNLLDLAALAVPAGFRGGGTPWGVTFIAPAWEEELLMNLGRRWEQGVAGGMSSGYVAAGNAVGIPDSTPPPNPPSGGARPPAPPAVISPAGTVPLAVVGAHLSGLPLNHQLTERGAQLVWSGTTSPEYRFFALPGTTPPKPGLVRVAMGGAAIAVEVWAVPESALGSFVAGVPPPLAIGSVRLATGEFVKGFLCESAALDGATDITAFGGWRAYLAASNRVRTNAM